ncbi:MAG: division/cell wall cluster transcriptional repressor MraZ [Verrucomicrobiales bacterium]|jgi:MraZ protein|nr:division/cell wall cluster transcriptional repressor MraZ [Verrucomicrobiales bacterium]
MSDVVKLSYTGTFEHAFDEKGRVTVPREWRGEGFESRLYVVPSSAGCLKVLTGSWLAEKTRELASLPMSDPRRKQFDKLAPFMQGVELDPQHRVMVRESLRVRAKLKKAAVLVGRFDHFEIWDAKVLRAAGGNEPLTVEEAGL